MKITPDNDLLPKEKAELKKAIIALDFGKDLTENDLQAVLRCGYRMTLKEGETFCTMGNRCDTIAFIVSGHLYAYYIIKKNEKDEKDEKGEKVVTNLFFAPKYRIVSDFESYLAGGVATRTIKAASGSTLICISITDLDALYITHPHLVKVERMLLIKSHIERNDAMEFLRRNNNRERIVAFLDLYPKVYNIFTNTVIGSYLSVGRKEVSAVHSGKG
jgi:hypothetical protein